MIFNKTILSVGLIAVALPHMAHAQALKNVKEPANLPPADYKGAQYVDNNGCIFVRAGRLGVVNWVPRIDQARKHMCSPNYTATFPEGGTPKPAAKPETQVATLDRGNVDFSGDVVKPVPAPDTSLIQTNEAPKPAAKAKEAPNTAAADAKKAAEQAASEARAAKLAEQERAAAKLRADAIAKKEADAQRKAAQLAEAQKQAEMQAAEKAQEKSKLAQMLAQDKEARLAKRAAAKAARAQAAADRKAQAAAKRAARVAAQEAKAAEAAKAPVAQKPVVVAQKPAEVKPDAAQQQADRQAAAQQLKDERAAAAAARKAAAEQLKEERAAAAAAKKQAALDAKAAEAARKSAAFKEGYYVDLDVVLNASKANETSKRMLASGYKVKVTKVGNGAKVFIGPFRSESNARVAYYQATNEGFKKAKVIKK